MNETFDMASWRKKWENPELFTPEKREEKYEVLRELLKYELKWLESLRANCAFPEREGFDSRIVQRLAKTQHKLLNLLVKIGVPGLFPFVAVPIAGRDEVLTTFKMVMSLSRPGERLEPALNFEQVFDVKQGKPRSKRFSHFMINVNEGRLTDGFSPKDVIAQIEAAKFFCPDLGQTIAYIKHSDLLRHPFCVYACGSRYRDNKLVPVICNDQGNRTLTWGEIDKARAGSVCPSYQMSLKASSLEGFFSLKAYIRLGAWERIRRGFFTYRKPLHTETENDVDIV
ncbi:MAG: hypothetical protein NTW11_03725 [Candidatus Staskawiczbacteria bacterium]|nr:hypothetical protein [Candidatus Staskawiczbacteria bacterium]